MVGYMITTLLQINCPQSGPVKEFWKSINNWRYGQWRF